MAINDLEKIIHWKQEYPEVPESIPRVSLKQQHKDGLLIKTWDEECQSVKGGVEELSKIIHDIWDSSSDILSEFRL